MSAQKRYRNKKHEIKLLIPKDYQETLKESIQSKGYSYQKVFEHGLRTLGTHWEDLAPPADLDQLELF